MLGGWRGGEVLLGGSHEVAVAKEVEARATRSRASWAASVALFSDDCKRGRRTLGREGVAWRVVEGSASVVGERSRSCGESKSSAAPSVSQSEVSRFGRFVRASSAPFCRRRNKLVAKLTRLCRDTGKKGDASEARNRESRPAGRPRRSLACIARPPRTPDRVYRS